MRVPETFLIERDAKIYVLRLSGADFRTIAKMLKISPSTAHKGYLRELRRRTQMGSEEAEYAAHKQIDQLDNLMAQLWPLARERKVPIPGSPDEYVTLPPSMEAIDRILKAITIQAKIYGTDVRSIPTVTQVGPAIGGATQDMQITAETQAKELVKEYLKVGVMAGEAAELLKKALELEEPDIEDAVVIEDSFDDEPLALPESTGDDLPPMWDDGDEDYVVVQWKPDRSIDGSSFKEVDSKNSAK